MSRLAPEGTVERRLDDLRAEAGLGRKQLAALIAQRLGADKRDKTFHASRATHAERVLRGAVKASPEFVAAATAALGVPLGAFLEDVVTVDAYAWMVSTKSEAGGVQVALAANAEERRRFLRALTLAVQATPGTRDELRSRAAARSLATAIHAAVWPLLPGFHHPLVPAPWRKGAIIRFASLMVSAFPAHPDGMVATAVRRGVEHLLEAESVFPWIPGALPGDTPGHPDNTMVRFVDFCEAGYWGYLLWAERTLAAFVAHSLWPEHRLPNASKIRPRRRGAQNTNAGGRVVGRTSKKVGETARNSGGVSVGPAGSKSRSGKR